MRHRAHGSRKETQRQRRRDPPTLRSTGLDDRHATRVRRRAASPSACCAVVEALASAVPCACRAWRALRFLSGKPSRSTVCTSSPSMPSVAGSIGCSRACLKRAATAYATASPSSRGPSAGPATSRPRVPRPGVLLSYPRARPGRRGGSASIVQLGGEPSFSSSWARPPRASNLACMKRIVVIALALGLLAGQPALARRPPSFALWTAN